jgi:hypothetical protein
MFKKILLLDFETRWSRSAVSWAPDGYTLSKMTTEEYIRSPLFKAFGAGYRWYGEENGAVYLPHAFLKQFFDSIDWSETAVCCHNAQFDVAILTWIYGHKPAFIFDTLSMARALRGIEVGNSAAKLAEAFNLPPKGTDVSLSDGLFELPFDVEQKLAAYCKHDVWLCEQFLDRLMPGYPKKELRLIDATIRMFTEPQLALDTELLKEAIDEDVAQRAALLGRLGVTDEQLASSGKFAEVLRAVGVEPPTKISPTTKKEVYAFAKNDALFQQLLNGDNEDAVLLCEARMKVKSTQERTRAQRFLDISTRGNGLLPVPVNYAHTRTLRWGAAKGSNINMQNLKRGGRLRKAIIAPPGHLCVAGDLSQIEPRVLAYLSDFTELIQIFASGKDAYAQFGAGMFGIPGLSRESHPDLRQSAKSALLGCFHPSTKVLTSRGWLPIVQVELTDKLWDGQAWVSHSGVVNQGVKETFFHRGVWATDDHKILAGKNWHVWKEVRTNPSLFKKALFSVNLPVSDGRAYKIVAEHGHISRRCNALVEQYTPIRVKKSFLEKQNVVMHVGCAGQNRQLKADLANLSRFFRDTASVNSYALIGDIKENNMPRGCAALVDGKDLCKEQTLSMGYPPDAMLVQEKKPQEQTKQKTLTLQYAKIERTELDFSTEYLPLLADAPTKQTPCIQIMAVGASVYILNGLKSVPNFWNISLRWKDGTIPLCSLTASKTIKDMSRAISDFAHAASTWLTNAKSKLGMSKNLDDELPTLKKRTQTYDILMAGPRNRYTILTDDGPIIAHNCGYRLGWASFASQLLVGFLGAPPVRYDKPFMKQLGIGGREVVKFMEGGQGRVRLERMMQIPHTCTDQELLVHCVCAKEIIDRYRATSQPIVKFWNFLDKMVATVLAVPDAAPVQYKCLTFRPNEIQLPNGLVIRYENIQVKMDAFNRPQYSYWNGKTHKALHSGIVAENVTSGTARCVIGDGMLRIQNRYRCAMPVHDEAVYVVEEDNVEEATKYIKEQLIAPVPYLPGIPLDASVGYAKRYGDAK